MHAEADRNVILVVQPTPTSNTGTRDGCRLSFVGLNPVELSEVCSFEYSTSKPM